MVGEAAVFDTVGGNTGQKKKSMRENKVKETKEGIDWQIKRQKKQKWDWEFIIFQCVQENFDGITSWLRGDSFWQGFKRTGRL